MNDSTFKTLMNNFNTFAPLAAEKLTSDLQEQNALLDLARNSIGIAIGAGAAIELTDPEEKRCAITPEAIFIPQGFFYADAPEVQKIVAETLLGKILLMEENFNDKIVQKLIRERKLAA